MITLTDDEKAALEEAGYTLHDGGSAPESVAEMTRVSCAIWTVDGVRFSAPGPAYVHIWEWVLHDNGFGAIVGWKLDSV
jgi:hypothetical protein